MSIFQLATLLIYVTSVLTSTVNETSKNDQNQPSSALENLFGSPRIATKNPMLLSDTRSVNHDDSDTVAKPVEIKSILSEGGPLAGYAGVEIKSSTNLDFINNDGSSPRIPPRSSDKATNYVKPKESSIHGRKGVGNGEMKGKTVGKKGVGSYSTPPTAEIIPAKELLTTVPSSTEMPVEIKPSLSSLVDNTEGKSSPKDINSVKKPDINSDNNARPHVLVIHQSNDTTPNKRKPTWTTSNDDDDGGMPSSPTQTEIGMPRKVDYIIPLVITIMATPVLGIAAYILYTRGRDCWDKRHYSRMDFLVDGMYND